MRRLVPAAILMAVLTTMAGATQVTPAQMALEAARRVEVVDGDLRGAIQKYRAIVLQYEETERTVAATALLRMGACFQRLNNQQAGPIYNRVVRDFGDQPAVVSEARRMLATLSTQAAGEPDGLVCPQCGDGGAALSPDGQWMVVHDWDSGDLAKLDLATLDRTRLNIKTGDWASPDEARSPALSRDGSVLAYLWYSAEADDRGEPPYAMRTLELGSGSHRTVLASPATLPIPLAWSADGASILAEILRREAGDTTSELAWVSVADGAVNAVMKIGERLWNRRVSVSPDGRFIAYSAMPPDGFMPVRRGPTEEHVYVIPSGGGPEETMAGGAGLNRTPVWSPDGSRLVYLSNVSGTWDLWTVPVAEGRATGDPVIVRKSVGDSSTIGVTPSGRLYYYQSHPGVMESSIVSVGQPGSPTKVIGSKPTWSPDGTSIALVRPRPPAGSGPDVVVRNLVSGAERSYSRNGQLGFPILWFRDGALLNVVEEDQRQYWYRIGLGDGQFQRLAEQRGDPAYETHFNVKTLSPDGRTLYQGTYAPLDPAVEGRVLDRMVALDLASGVHREVFRLPGTRANLPRAAQEWTLAVSPDGKTIAMTHYDPQAEMSRLALVDVDGQNYRVLTSFPSWALRNKLAWTADARWIFYATQQGEARRVMRIASSGGEPEFTGIEVERLDAFDVSPDGTRVIYSTLGAVGGREELHRIDVSSLVGSR